MIPQSLTAIVAKLLRRERVRNVLGTAERDAKAGRTGWMSAPERRAENAKQRAGG